MLSPDILKLQIRDSFKQKETDHFRFATCYSTKWMVYQAEMWGWRLYGVSLHPHNAGYTHCRLRSKLGQSGRMSDTLIEPRRVGK